MDREATADRELIPPVVAVNTVEATVAVEAATILLFLQVAAVDPVVVDTTLPSLQAEVGMVAEAVEAATILLFPQVVGVAVAVAAEVAAEAIILPSLQVVDMVEAAVEVAEADITLPVVEEAPTHLQTAIPSLLPAAATAAQCKGVHHRTIQKARTPTKTPLPWMC